MKQSLKQIVEVLLENDNFLSFQDISKLLGFSKRHISQVIGDSQNESALYGFHIINHFRKGYELIIDDIVKFEEISTLDDDYVKRINEVLKYLVDLNDSIRIEDLAEKFYTSRSTMDRIIKDAKKIAEKYELEIANKSKSGICIEGSEINKRMCSAHCGFDEKEQEQKILRIQEILYETLQTYDYTISDLSYNNLAYHILILLKRINSGMLLIEEITLRHSYELQKQIASKLIEELQKEFHTEIPKNEINYLVLHLLGKQIINENQEIRPRIYDLSDKILNRIKEKKGIDLTKDIELRISLCLHLQPLLHRLKYHFNQENPMLTRIKREMSTGYELSLIAKEVINETFGLILNDYEASYLAMHFSLSLIKENESEQKIKLLVICSTGRGTSRLLQYKLMEKYGLSDENIILTSLMQVRNMDVSEYSCIVSTIAVPFEVPIPVIMITPMLDDASAYRVEEFIKSYSQFTLVEDNNSIFSDNLIFSDLQFTSRDEILRFISNKCKEEFGCDDIMYEELMQRETLSATEVGNKCSMPHPLNYFPNQPILIILILRKPIVWHREKVKFIFFCALPKNDERRLSITDGLTALVCSKEKLQKIAVNPTVQQIKECIWG